MKIIRRISLTISMLLFSWLFISSLNQIELKNALTNANFREELYRVENFKNIQELKNFTKSKMYQYNRVYMENSERNKKFLFVIFSLIIVQFIIYLTSNYSKNRIES